LYQDGIGIDDAVGRPAGLTPTGRGSVVLNKVIPSSARIKRIVPSWEADLTSVIGDKMIKLVGWYDNEAGYSNRCIDLMLKLNEF
jgi:glyceraldehyde-3-phosphate dehydrogenase/erythrose-4-phosphate dehydrogenase